MIISDFSKLTIDMNITKRRNHFAKCRSPDRKRSLLMLFKTHEAQICDKY
jgi:hypothetical protein